MKKSVTSLLIIAGLLQGCASTVSPKKEQASADVKGSIPLALSSKDCPGGMALLHLYADTTAGNEARLNASVDWTAKAIDKDVELYSTVGAKQQKKRDRKKNKVDTDDTQNSIVVGLSFSEDPEVGNTSARYAVVGGKNTSQFTKTVALNYDGATKTYHKWKELPSVALTEKDQLDGDQKLINMISLKIGNKVSSFAIPSPLDSADLATPLSQKIKGETGKPIEINIAPNTSGRDAFLYAQFIPVNKNEKKRNFMSKDDGSGVFKVATDDVPAGEYNLMLYRREVYGYDSGDEGAIKRCVDVASGVRALASISAPAPAKK